MRKIGTFFIGGIRFGIDVLKVLGVLQNAEIVRVPLANGVIAGLIQYRGQIITVIDLRRKLEMAPLEGQEPMHMIIKTKKGIVSFLVDEVSDVIEITQNTKVEMSKSVQGVDSFFISHTYKFEDFTLLILDTERIAEVKSGSVI